MKIKREELLSVLVAVKPGLARKEIEEQSTHFVFTGDSVTTYNDQICISHPFKTDFKLSVKADEFHKILSGMSDEEVEISFKDKNLFIKGAKTRSGMATLAEGNILKMIKELGLDDSKRKWKKLPKDFVNGVFLCMFSASRVIGTGVYGCVHVKGDVVESTDNYRVSQYKLESDLKDEVLLPVSAVQELVKFPITKFFLSDSWVYFKTDENVMFASRYIVGEFPDCSSFFKLEGDAITFPTGLKKIVEDVSVMSDAEVDYKKKIDVTIEKGKITCRAEKERGWVEKDMELKYKGKTIKLSVNPIFFAQILDKSVTMTLQGDRALFVSDSFKHIMALPETK